MSLLTQVKEAKEAFGGNNKRPTQVLVSKDLLYALCCDLKRETWAGDYPSTEELYIMILNNDCHIFEGLQILVVENLKNQVMVVGE